MKCTDGLRLTTGCLIAITLAAGIGSTPSAVAQTGNTALVLRGSYDSVPNDLMVKRLKSIYGELLFPTGTPDDPTQTDFSDPVRPAVTDFTVSVKGNRLRMDVGGSSLLAGLKADGSPTEWAVLDPASGRVVKQAVWYPETHPTDAVNTAFSLVFGEMESGISSSPVERRGTSQIAGHTAREYGYGYQIRASAPDGPDLMFAVKGSVWVVEEGPYKDDPALRAFQLTAGSHVFSRMFLDPPAEVAAIADKGPMVKQTEETTYAIGSEPVGMPLVVTALGFKVDVIRREPLDDSRFAGFERQEQNCDCSCEAWDELEGIGKLSEAEQAAHPKAMTLSMCMPACVGTWMKSCM